MAYRFRQRESVPQGVRRVALEELNPAIRNLTGQSGVAAEKGVHEARKSIKKARALLRLVKAEPGLPFGAWNATHRALGQRLAEYRDATAFVTTVDDLIGRTNATSHKRVLASVQHALTAHKAGLQHAPGFHKTLADAAGGLQRVREEIQRASFPDDGYAALRAGFDQAFRRGRKALARAAKDPSPENLHEWRKRVKDHWYHVRLLQNAWDAVKPGHKKALEKLKKLETWLGDDHNLSLLRNELVSKAKAYGSKQEIDGVIEIIDRRRKRLGRKALAQGSGIYGRRPRSVSGEMENVWEAWKA